MENSGDNCNSENEICSADKESSEGLVNEYPLSKSCFTIDRTCIPTVSENEQEKELCELDIQVYQQDVLEKEILNQVDKAIENQKQQKAEEIALKNEKKTQKQAKLKTEKKQQNEEESLEVEKEKEVDSDNFNSVQAEETERERKIRLGEMTPFGTVLSLKTIEGNNLENVEEYLMKQIEVLGARKSLKRKNSTKKGKFIKRPKKGDNSVLKKNIFFPKKKQKKQALGTHISDDFCGRPRPRKLPSETISMDVSSGSEYVPTESDPDSDDLDCEWEPKSADIRKKKKRIENLGEKNLDLQDSDSESIAPKMKKEKKEVDDGDEDKYLKRLEDWEKRNSRENTELEFKSLGDGFKIPLIIWNKLYKYQKVGVQWLYELNIQRCGGILGDEMGLGKTIQIIAFLSGLSVSKLISRHGSFRGLGPVLIVCPTTVMHQWVREFHCWWPQFRVALLHESGSFNGEKHSLISDIVKKNGILITSYVTCVQQSNSILRHTWHYVVLDEGHKIRNPDSLITSTVKLLRTPHRLILSGSPMQNNLKELWCLFDFIFPGKLGTLPVFMAELAVPITQGGYANASKVQIATAFKCASVLRDTISPYLLRRVKEDVKSHINLPPKNEQVLFCRLTEEQKELYLNYLNSGKVSDILSGKYKVFVGLIDLRKICNHPHLYTGGPKVFKWENPNLIPEEERFGYWKKAGKMIVVESLLRIWKKQGHRVLIFTQSRQMLRILEAFVQSQNYDYIKIDGSTTISVRQPLINKFNEDKKYYIFLSTTHVGGLGVNLTGANRVVIYDPDWNPATDTQARERAWRIGQENQVTIYRLVTSGTIEEKIYHRQIFKQFLANKVLKDPAQRRFFKSNDLYELFTYKDSDKGVETAAIFAGTDCEVKNLTHRQKVKKIKGKMRLGSTSVKKDASLRKILTKEKIEEMKQKAQQLSRKISLELSGKGNETNEVAKNIKIGSVIDGDNKDEKLDIEVSKLLTKEENEVDEVRPRERKKHKKKRKKDAIFEGEVVPHLQKQMQYRDVVKEPSQSEANDDDDYILKKLLSKSGVQSALKHDQIMQGESVDFALVEGEAEKVAKEAVRALKESRRQCNRVFEESQPNTLSKPRFGRKSLGQKLPQNKGGNGEKNVGMTSAELLQRIRQRNGLCSVVSNVQDSPLNMHSELLVDIRNFISFGAQRYNKATTQEIVDKFRDQLPSGQTPLFKALLNEICEFHRTLSGEGVWELRSEFRW